MDGFTCPYCEEWLYIERYTDEEIYKDALDEDGCNWEYTAQCVHCKERIWATVYVSIEHGVYAEKPSDIWEEPKNTIELE